MKQQSEGKISQVFSSYCFSCKELLTNLLFPLFASLQTRISKSENTNYRGALSGASKREGELQNKAFRNTMTF